MRNIKYCVVFFIFLVTSLRAEVLSVQPYKNINTYELYGVFDRDIKLQSSYGIFSLKLVEDVYSVYTTQLLFPEGTEVVCGYDKNVFFEGVMSGPKCNSFRFILNGKLIEGKASNIVVTNMDGKENIGPNIKAGYKVKISIGEITSIKVTGEVVQDDNNVSSQGD